MVSDGQVCKGFNLKGSIKDPTGALIPGAEIQLGDGLSTESGAAGAFEISCIPNGDYTLKVSKEGFAGNELSLRLPLHSRELVVTLIPSISVGVDVDADDSSDVNTAVGPSQIFKGDQLSELADDPDDLQRELQQMAEAMGGDPKDTVITVDGFQDNAKVPPHSAIAYLRVNADLYSAEYRQPPAGGGRVEVFTKPGGTKFHGDMFATNSSSWMNAENPFSTDTGAIGKQRYGFDFDGPLAHKNSDFSISLEYRSIANTVGVDAYTLDAAGATVQTLSTVQVPQTRWIASARFDFQLGPKNTFMISYGPWRNHMDDVGVGGNVLGESGYSASQYDDVVRLFDVTTLSTKLMHAIHLSARFTGETDTPNSSSPQIIVSGAFTGGGAPLGEQHLRESFSELDDDATIFAGSHSLRVGVQSFLLVERPKLTNDFNGSYTFGGGTGPLLDTNGAPIPGQTTIMTGLEQYRRTLLNLPGGSPTVYTNVTGTPSVDYAQVSAAFFIQDEWNASHCLHVSAGARYYIQNNPLLANGFTPRIGLSCSLGRKNTVSLHAHYGLFTGRFNSDDANEWHREDGTQRITNTVYNPVYQNPFANATSIQTVRILNPSFSNSSQGLGNFGATINMRHSWQATGDIVFGRQWNAERTVNINSPTNDQPLGPRPIAPDINILQLQNSGQGHLFAATVTLSQNKLKRFQLNLGGSYIRQVDDFDGNVFFTPQSSSSDAGEFARRSGQPTWHVFGNSTVHAPGGINFSAILNVSGGQPYNVLTGTDNNADGDFNDRPEYAAPGTLGAIPTRFGLLTSVGGIAVFPRNAGNMPKTAYLDINAQRSFSLTQSPRRDHSQSLTFNIRSSNVLNVTNVTAVGNVLGSPQFASPIAADNSRRIEVGARYNF